MAGPGAAVGAVPRATIRIDKWLWHARFYKTRSLATRAVQDGAIRVNAERVVKPACLVAAGDTLTFAQGERIRVVRVAEIGIRRGPAPEAQTLYEDLSPPPAPPGEVARNPGFDGGGRPTKKDRRALDLSRRGPLE